MLSLPIEIIIKICSYMNVSDIYVLSTVCRELYKIKKYVPIMCKIDEKWIINLNINHGKKERYDVLNTIVNIITSNQSFEYKKLNGYFELYLKDIDYTLFLCFENVSSDLTYTQTIINSGIENKINIINDLFGEEFVSINNICEDNINQIIGKIVHNSICKYSKYVLKINFFCQIRKNFIIIDFTKPNMFRIIKRNFDDDNFILIKYGEYIEKKENPINNKLLIDKIYDTFPKNIANENKTFYEINVNKIFMGLYLNFEDFLKYYNNLIVIKNKKMLKQRKKKYL